MPVAVLVSLILFLTATAYADAVTTVDVGLPGHPVRPIALVGLRREAEVGERALAVVVDNEPLQSQAPELLRRPLPRPFA
jgi:hypothetical protein